MARIFERNFATGLLVGCVVAVGVAASAITYERYDTKTLKRTVRRDAVYCGVNTGLPGFSAEDGKGKWSGFDVARATSIRRLGWTAERFASSPTRPLNSTSRIISAPIT